MTIATARGPRTRVDTRVVAAPSAIDASITATSRIGSTAAALAYSAPQTTAMASGLTMTSTPNSPTKIAVSRRAMASLWACTAARSPRPAAATSGGTSTVPRASESIDAGVARFSAAAKSPASPAPA